MVVVVLAVTGGAAKSFLSPTIGQCDGVDDNGDVIIITIAL